MKFIALLVAGLFTAYMVAFGGWTIYIDRTEFKPAMAEWDAAKARGDRAAMWRAFDKEMAAAKKGINPRMWWQPPETKP